MCWLEGQANHLLISILITGCEGTLSGQRIDNMRQKRWEISFAGWH